MGYEPTNWKTGDVITAEKLNKLEDGVASGGGGSSDAFLFFTLTSMPSGVFKYECDKTPQDVFDEVKAYCDRGEMPNIVVKEASESSGAMRATVTMCCGLTCQYPVSSSAQLERQIMIMVTPSQIIYGNVSENKWLDTPYSSN